MTATTAGFGSFALPMLADGPWGVVLLVLLVVLVAQLLEDVAVLWAGALVASGALPLPLALAATGRFDARWDPLLDEGRVKFFSRATLTALLTEFDLQELHFETIGRVPMFARSMLMSGKKPG